MVSLVEKYNVAGPRYTSYPTVPFWKNDPLQAADWLHSLRHNRAVFGQAPVSVYVHLPYCESMCTFCGCHKRITKNHGVEQPYIDAVIREWQHYQQEFDFEVKELHLGGGTPTFFAPQQLERLVQAITGEVKKGESVHFGFEAHPNFTNRAHLETLYQLGFTRLSLGIQDYDPTVQKAIHRIQSFEQVKHIHQMARDMGYTSISHDLVFGLPKQELSGFMRSVELTIDLKPDRVSLYSYAHVPWIKGNGQRGFDEQDLPDNDRKRTLYEEAKKRFLAAGYLEIGMDHFALPHDELALAFVARNLHRNFMGYTTQQTDLLIGLGASAISDSWYAFAQNEKHIETYLKQVEAGQLPVFRGHLLSEDDLQIRKHILDLMCHFETSLPDAIQSRATTLHKLQPLVEDGLVVISEHKVQVTERGVPFVRNVCMAFDAYLQGEVSQQLFSKVI